MSSPFPKHTLRELGAGLRSGELTAEALCQSSLDAVAAFETPDSPVFLSVFHDEAREAALAIDKARRSGQAQPEYAGIPFAAKDLFDIAGKVTRAGAQVTDNDPPAERDAVVVDHLRKAGFVLIGTTNMTEFAFSGIGINPHFGTPEAACWPSKARVPGGSSSGAAVSLGRGMVPLSLGTDTAGSCRIPAAWNGVVGLKPSQSRVSREGVFPLSHTLDAPGPLAHTVDCCRVADAIMRGVPVPPERPTDLTPFRFVVPDLGALPSLDPEVQELWQHALDTLSDSGATLVSEAAPLFEQAAESFLTSPIAGYEAWLVHRDRLAHDSGRYDPNVAARLQAGESIDPDDHRTKLAHRATLAQNFQSVTPEDTFYLLPTTANIPPEIEVLRNDNEKFRETNLRALTLTSISNFLDACAISLPLGGGVGCSVIGPNGSDDRLFDAAGAIEKHL